MSILDSILAMKRAGWDESEIREQLQEDGLDADDIAEFLEDANHGDHGQ